MSESVSGRQHLDDVGFDELRALASAAGDKMSLAMAMAGQVGALIVHARFAEASSLASEYVDLVESIGDPTLIVALLYAAVSARSVTGEMTEAIRLSQADSAALRETAEILAIAERSGDDFTLAGARYSRGLTLVTHDGPARDEGLAGCGAPVETKPATETSRIATSRWPNGLTSNRTSLPPRRCEGFAEREPMAHSRAIFRHCRTLGT